MREYFFFLPEVRLFHQSPSMYYSSLRETSEERRRPQPAVMISEKTQSREYMLKHKHI